MELLTENDPMSQQIEHATIKLKPHQLVLLKKCHDFENKPQRYKGDEFQTGLGILGDKVGSGKSYIILSLIYTTIDKPLDCIGNIKVMGLDKIVMKLCRNMKNVDTNVLVLPHNLIHQWKALITKFDIKSLFVCANSQIPEAAIIEDYNIIVVSSSIYKQFATKFSSVQFKRVFFDEVDTINIPNCPQLFSNFTWFITASYNNLVYPKGLSEWNQAIQKYIVISIGLKNKGYINNLFLDISSKISSDFIRRLVLKNHDDFVDKSFSLPEVITENVICRPSVLINILNGVVNPDVIACLNAEDVASAISIVNVSMKGTEDSIISVILSKYHRSLNNIDLNIEYNAKREFDHESSREKELCHLHEQKQCFEYKVSNIRDRIKETNTCNICFDNISNKTITKCCQNSFCFKCITKWMNIKNSCPFCNENVQMKDCFVVQDKDEYRSEKREETLSITNDKITNLKVLMDMLKHKKMLIFSSYNESFKSISQIMRTKNIKYDYIKGTSNHIKNVVDNYKTGDLNALLINAINYGSGLNFENTTDIIIFHQFSEECTRQVIGRAQRMGRTEPLKVWYLLNENEHV